MLIILILLYYNFTYYPFIILVLLWLIVKVLYDLLFLFKYRLLKINKQKNNINSYIFLKEASKYKIKCYDYGDLVQHVYLSVIKSANIYKGEDKNLKICL